MENILKNESTVTDPRMPLWFGQTQDYVAALRNGAILYWRTIRRHVKRSQVQQKSDCRKTE